jgi:hypothetical protein
LYLAVVMDLCSRRVVGWSMSSRLSTDLVLRAFWMAVLSRRPAKGLMFHSDRGSQYASHAFRGALRHVGAIQSMSRKGDCWDNGVPRTLKGGAPWEMGVDWPPGIGLQDRIPNYIELPEVKSLEVVSVDEKGVI